MPLVQRYKTNVHIDALRQAQHASFHVLYGTCPGDLFLRSACVHNLLELGYDHQTLYTLGLWRYNVGNIDASWLDRLRYDVFETVLEREVRPDGTEYKQVHRRRAYKALGQGCSAYWEKMTKYHSVMARGDLTAFALEMKCNKYYTETLEKYTFALLRLAKVYDARYAGESMYDLCGWLE